MKHTRATATYLRQFHPRLRVAKRRRRESIRRIETASLRLVGRHDYCALAVRIAAAMKRRLGTTHVELSAKLSAALRAE